MSGFHGLYNFFLRTPQNIFFSKKKLFKNALKNLDHLFFSVKKIWKNAYLFLELMKEKQVYLDLELIIIFWKPIDLQKNIDVFSLGSDVHRNYEIFNKINLDLKFLFLTKRGKNLVKKKNYSLLGGSKNEPLISDKEIRDFYSKSKIVVVSLHDTYQPSGQSVTLQAMACGKPVILTKIRSLGC